MLYFCWLIVKSWREFGTKFTKNLSEKMTEKYALWTLRQIQRRSQNQAKLMKKANSILNWHRTFWHQIWPWRGGGSYTHYTLLYHKAILRTCSNPPPDKVFNKEEGQGYKKVYNNWMGRMRGTSEPGEKIEAREWGQKST